MTRFAAQTPAPIGLADTRSHHNADRERDDDRQKARSAGVGITAASARAAELDFAAYDYCERNGIYVPPGSFPPSEVYAAIGGADHPRIVAEERKRRNHILRAQRHAEACQRYRERHKGKIASGNQAVRWLKVGEHETSRES